MGSINSVPVLSQVKSLVQVIGGDAEGAKKTQVEFSRKAILVSSINQIVHLAKGDYYEADKIAKEHLGDLLSFAENTPVVGHVTSGIHALTGNIEKARQVAIGATKSTVVLAAGVAGAVCGPGAAVCGAGLALEANALWDVADSAIAGEDRGMVKTIDNMRKGEADIEEIFDFTAGQVMTAVGGATGAKAAGNFLKNRQNPKTSSNPCRRSVDAHSNLFNDQFPKLNQETLNLLPGSLHEVNVNDQNFAHPSEMVTTIFSIFVILKLMVVGHPDSKPYYQEICGGKTSPDEVSRCEENLYEALQKYNLHSNDLNSYAENSLEESLESLVFEMNHLVRNSSIGFNLRLAVCQKNSNLSFEFQCLSLLDDMLDKLRDTFKMLSLVHVRVKRCPPPTDTDGWTTVGKRPKAPKPKIATLTNAFFEDHLLDKSVFNDIFNTKAGTSLNPKLINYLKKKLEHRMSKTTTLMEDTLHNFDMEKASFVKDVVRDGKTHHLYMTADLNLIKADPLKNTVEVGKGSFQFFYDKANKQIYHVENSIIFDLREFPVYFS